MATTTSVAAKPPRDNVLAWQVAFGIVMLLLWQLAGSAIGTQWISSPELVARKLLAWVAGDLLLHVGVTVVEMIAGLVIGTCLGALAGLMLGRSPVASTLLRPIVVAFYSVPLVALAPLLIMFFGLDLAPKIILVSVVVFFLLLFSTMTGAESVDRDFVSMLQLMGATRRETFQKVVVPACVAWIVNGVKIALPYSLVAAVTAEMLGSRRGLGQLLTQASSQFDMTGIYAILFVLMLIGLLVSESAARMERWLLRWRQGTA